MTTTGTRDVARRGAGRRPTSKARHAERRKAPASRAAPTVAGIRISHPDRLIYPDLGISKIQFARYYERIGDWIHVAGRPLTLVHCPAGIAAPCIYLKHAKAWGPNALRRVKIQEKTKVGEYLRNNRTNTSVSAFSPRARPGATVSMPLGWNDLGDAPERWTLLTVPRRLERLRVDPWSEYWQCDQALSAATLATVARLSSK